MQELLQLQHNGTNALKTAIILGAGFAGCTIAHLLKNKGWEVKVLEKSSHPGGGCKTLFYGGHPYTNGPRLYYGYSEKVFKWISKFVDMRDLDFQLRSYVESERRESARANLLDFSTKASTFDGRRRMWPG